MTQANPIQGIIPMSEQTQSDVIVESSPQVEAETPETVEAVENQEAKEPEQTETTEDDENSDSLPNGVKKRIDKLTRQKYEAQAELNRLKAEFEALKAQSAPKAVEPQMSDFDTFDDYTEALAEYKYNQKTQAQAQQYNQQAQAQKVAQEWQSKVEKVRAVAPDFDEAFANVAEITFAQSTLDAVAGHEKGAEIAYLLGKDPVKAYQIASLPPMQQLMAIGEIAAKTNLTRPKTVTNAPPPVKPVSGKSSIVDPNSLSMKEWVAYRNKQLRQK
ncbi:MAG TPA: hypothetical protein PKL69_08860 [Agitococcus sp.]|nr:hypothetical protein [Agitococcus sp.]